MEEEYFEPLTKLEATKAKLEAQDFTNLTKDDILGDLLYTTALSYHGELGMMNQISAKTMGVMAITLPSETIFSSELKSNFAFGIPISVSSGALAMDADRLMPLVKALDGDKEKPKQFMLAAGMNSSAHEHSLPEQLFSTPETPAQGISAIKALQIANDQGIPVYTIDQSNIAIVLPQLRLDSETIVDIQNAVNAGKEVTVSKTNVTFNGWTGCGYIIIDPTTGSGAYMISGGMNGGMLLVLTLLVFAFLLLAIAVAIGPLALVIVSLLMPIYLGFQTWLATQASEKVRECVKAIATSLLILWANFYKFIALGDVPILKYLKGPFLAMYFAVARIEQACF